MKINDFVYVSVLKMPRQKKQRPADEPFDQPIYLITTDSSDDEITTEKSLSSMAEAIKEEKLAKQIKQEQEWNIEEMTKDMRKGKQKKAKPNENTSKKVHQLSWH